MRKVSSQKEDPWADDYFIDLSSSSSQRPREFPGERQPPSRKPASGGRSRPGPVSFSERSGRPASRDRPRSSARSPKKPTVKNPREPRGVELHRTSGRPMKKQKLKKGRGPRRPMGRKAKVFLYGFTFLSALVGTALLCIFLLFRVSEVQVTGDVVYEEGVILEACNFQKGDNLVFLPASAREKELTRKFPYIEKAKIVRRLPGQVEIQITAAKVGSSVAVGDSWLYVSEGNKILEQRDEPAQGVMQVIGLTPKSTESGTLLNTGEEEEAESGLYQAGDAYRVIMKKLVELGMVDQFTRLDVSDPYNIVLWYQNRIKFLMGSSVDLGYKTEFGCRTVSDESYIGLQEMGVLDLSLASDVKRSSFTAQTASEFQQDTGISTPAPNPDEDSSASSGSSPDDTDSSLPEGDSGSSESDRGAGIPDSAFTGDEDTGNTDGTEE